ncbi:hypothetical protein DPEC_G00204700 [Dallia pectoralis]|uniref:Uncharacterized protein n=1 Tax=Dallia pectoralis TaxID=75939 RepID=A0ACC2G4F1_DALPE|nr:hypothetical protein DPEC_G00204700 [Dallia pectoralis]
MTQRRYFTELVQVTEATSSVNMELLGFKRGMTELTDKGLDVEVMATDRSTSIQKLMREQYPEVQHEFDIWHTAKAHEQKMRMWITKDSVAFQDLSSLVLDKRLLRDMEKMGLFKHTGPLEVFHSALLKYLSKRQAFSFQGMRERCQLAILEHNENIVKRKQATTTTGQARFKQVFSRRSKQWVLKKIFTPHNTKFIDTLIQRVMDRRRNPNIVFKAPATSCLSVGPPAMRARRDQMFL